MKSFRIYALLGLAIWMAHFSLAKWAGLYEDDYSYISPSFGWNFTQLSAEIANNFVRWPQGRPIGFSLPPLFSFIGYSLDGLYGVYIIAFLILFINACLVYTLAKRMIGSESFALMAGLAFSLFPADTTHSFLMHATGLQPSLTFLLLASLCYLSGKTGVSYLIILGSLLTYESPFMVFMGVPLLQQKWDRKFAREFVRHIIILGVMLFCVLMVRRFTGDDRLQLGTEIFLIPIKILASMIIGPLASGGLSLFMPFTILFTLDARIIITMLLSVVIIGWIFFEMVSDHKSAFDGSDILIIPWVAMALDKWKVPPEYKVFIRIGFVGIVLLCLGYAVSFTHFPPIKYHGRLTSVHLAASLGWSILFACLGMFLILISDRYSLKSLGIAMLVIYFSFAVGYGVRIQEDFVRSWCAQKSFWAEALPLIRDLEDGTLIFFRYEDQSQPKYINIYSWADPIVLEQIYDFPADWQHPPRLFTFRLDWTKLIYLNGQQFVWQVPVATWPAHTEILPASNLILLKALDQSLMRVDGNIFIQGQEFFLKPIPSITTSSAFKKGPLYKLIMSNNECNSNN